MQACVCMCMCVCVCVCVCVCLVGKCGVVPLQLLLSAGPLLVLLLGSLLVFAALRLSAGNVVLLLAFLALLLFLLLLLLAAVLVLICLRERERVHAREQKCLKRRSNNTYKHECTEMEKGRIRMRKGGVRFTPSLVAEGHLVLSLA